MKTYLTVNYKVNELLSVGGLFHSIQNNGTTLMAYGISGTLSVGKIFSIGTLLSSSKVSPFNLGLNGSLNLGPVQFFATSDNILAAFKPLDNKYAHARFGLNLAFK